MEKYLRVGVITSRTACAARVKVYPTTDDAMRFKIRSCDPWTSEEGKPGVKDPSGKILQNMGHPEIRRG